MTAFEHADGDGQMDAARAGAIDHFLNGLMAIQDENFELGVTEFNEALKLDPEYSYAYLGLGKTLLEMNDHHKAIEYFRRYLSMNPKSVEGLILQGITYYEAGGLEDARKKFEQALTIQHKALQPLLDDNINLTGTVELSDARARLEKALLIGPADEGAMRLLGDIYYKLGATRSAERIKNVLGDAEAAQ
jgi:tetratricopeptide (TPR) repeat protein